MIGHSVTISLGEPWDFPHNPIEAVIEKSQVITVSSNEGEKYYEQLLVRSKKPFAYENMKSEFFLVSPRYVGERISNLQENGELTVGMHRITELRAHSDNPFTEKPLRGDEKSWAGIGIVKLCT